MYFLEEVSSEEASEEADVKQGRSGIQVLGLLFCCHPRAGHLLSVVRADRFATTPDPSFPKEGTTLIALLSASQSIVFTRWEHCFRPRASARCMFGQMQGDAKWLDVRCLLFGQTQVSAPTLGGSGSPGRRWGEA